MGRDILGTTFFRAESSLIQSSCRSFIQVIVPYERRYETSGAPLRFMLRRSSLVECVSVLPGNRCLQNVKKNFLRQYVKPCLLKNPKYTFYTIKSSHITPVHSKSHRVSMTVSLIYSQALVARTHHPPFFLTFCLQIYIQ